MGQEKNTSDGEESKMDTLWPAAKVLFISSEGMIMLAHNGYHAPS